MYNQRHVYFDISTEKNNDKEFDFECMYFMGEDGPEDYQLSSNAGNDLNFFGFEFIGEFEALCVAASERVFNKEEEYISVLYKEEEYLITRNYI